MENYVLVNVGKETRYAHEYYYVINYSDKISYSLKSNQVYVNDENRNLNADIYALGINILNSGILFGSSKGFIFSNEKGNIKKVEFKKVK